MSTVMLFAVIAVAAVVIYLAFGPGRTYFRFRGARVITCPENQRPAGVEVDAGHAAAGTLRGKVDLRLSSCSRWPEKQDCGQECLRQVEQSPEDCLVRNLLSRWYADKSCAVCGKPFGEIDWEYRKPALMNAQRKTFEWQEILPENVPAVLESSQPVCWPCHMATSFAKEHPELVIDRSRTA